MKLQMANLRKGQVSHDKNSYAWRGNILTYCYRILRDGYRCVDEGS